LNEPSGTYTTDRNAGEPTDRLAVSIEGKFCDSQTNVPLEGNFRLKNGFTFIGDFKEGKFNGEGHIIAPNGQLLYYGRFKNGAFDGKGVLMLPNGEVYEGKFANGKKHGEGTLTLSGGKVLNGEWEAGVLAARFTEG
jgi:hypothetical protein